MVHTWHLIKHKRAFIFSNSLIKFLKINLLERLFVAKFQKIARNKPSRTFIFSKTLIKLLKINLDERLFVAKFQKSARNKPSRTFIFSKTLIKLLKINLHERLFEQYFRKVLKINLHERLFLALYRWKCWKYKLSKCQSLERRVHQADTPCPIKGTGTRHVSVY